MKPEMSNDSKQLALDLVQWVRNRQFTLGHLKKADFLKDLVKRSKEPLPEEVLKAAFEYLRTRCFGLFWDGLVGFIRFRIASFLRQALKEFLGEIRAKVRKQQKQMAEKHGAD